MFTHIFCNYCQCRPLNFAKHQHDNYDNTSRCDGRISAIFFHQLALRGVVSSSSSLQSVNLFTLKSFDLTLGGTTSHSNKFGRRNLHVSFNQNVDTYVTCAWWFLYSLYTDHCHIHCLLQLYWRRHPASHEVTCRERVPWLVQTMVSYDVIAWHFSIDPSLAATDGVSFSLIEHYKLHCMKLYLGWETSLPTFFVHKFSKSLKSVDPIKFCALKHAMQWIRWIA